MKYSLASDYNNLLSVSLDMIDLLNEKEQV
jgi:hypothetical protein